VKCSQCGRKDTVEKTPEKDRKKILCSECRTGKKQPWWDWKVAVHPGKGKVQQSSAQTEVPEGIAKERGGQRELRRTFKMLKEV